MPFVGSTISGPIHRANPKHPTEYGIQGGDKNPNFNETGAIMTHIPLD